ncbi:MAG: hypothetical protein DWP94_12620 [Flavobacterium sp.]|nr:MAG: hypothetical protein DWP94_12620 [Flavobacterium sp.]
MSTLINLAIAVVASMLSITGVPQRTNTSAETEIVQCPQSIENLNVHFIIENEQLSQKIK